VSLVVHGQSIRFYVNGHKSDTLETNGDWHRPASPIIMGQTESEMERGENIFMGKVDNLRLIHHAIRNDHFTPEQHLAQKLARLVVHCEGLIEVRDDVVAVTWHPHDSGSRRGYGTPATDRSQSRIARSSFSCRFSRRGFLSSSRSALLSR